MDELWRCWIFYFGGGQRYFFYYSIQQVYDDGYSEQTEAAQAFILLDILQGTQFTSCHTFSVRGEEKLDFLKNMYGYQRCENIQEDMDRFFNVMSTDD
jgi:hypothetical protein